MPKAEEWNYGIFNDQVSYQRKPEEREASTPQCFSVALKAGGNEAGVESAG